MLFTHRVPPPVVLFVTSAMQLAKCQTAGPVSYSMISDHVSLHEPVVIRVQIKNTTGRPMDVDLGLQGSNNFRFTLTADDGTVAQVRPPLSEGFTPPGDFQLAPGATVSRYLLINRWLNLDRVGKYHLEVLLLSPLRSTDGEAVALDRGAAFTVEVTPRDEVRIRSVCAELLSRILAAQSFEAAEEPATVLATIADPAAVPYLLQASRSRDLVPIMTAALGKIGDAASADALLDLLNGKDPDARISARSALLRIEAKTADPDLRERIRIAIASVGATEP